MTQAQERLIAALESAAAAVRVEDMRPLVAPGAGQAGAPVRGISRHPRRRRIWLAAALPAAAGISALALAAALTGQRPSAPVRTAAYIGGSLPRVPAFFVDAGSTGLSDQTLRVISLATGKVTSTEHMPPGADDISLLAEQPQTGNYVAGFISSKRGLALYRFRITGTGQITTLIPEGRILPEDQPENITPLALSPDGAHLAVSLSANDIPAPAGKFDTKIILVNLGNGTQQVWNDGLTDRAHVPEITSAAWTPDGQALVFATRTCRLPQLNACTWEFRKLAAASGRLRAGPVLLHQPGTNSQTRQPEVSPDGGSVIEVHPGPGAGSSLVRINLAAGRQTVLFRSSGTLQAGPNVGNFEFIGQQVSRNKWRIAGWADADGFHPVPFTASF